MAEMAYSQALGEAVISGTDPTRGDLPYVNQVFIGYGGGAALHGYDGWLASGAACDGVPVAVAIPGWLQDLIPETTDGD